MPFGVERCVRGAVAAIALAFVGCIGETVEAQDLGRNDLEVKGLSVYTETARDIYIAGMLMPRESGLENLLLAPPPKGMEFRMATRRISGRGFAGMLLLQAELGSGNRAPNSAINALTVLKRKLKGSLKQGDQFVIFLNENDETLFLLNDIELHRVPDGGLFDFFFSGWVGPGAAATFSRPLLAGTLDPGIEARFDSLSPGEQRIASVEAWVQPPAEIAVAAAPTPTPDPNPEPDPADVPAPAALEPATPAPATTEVASADASEQVVAPPEPLPADAGDTPLNTEETPRPAPVQEVASAVAIKNELESTGEPSALDDAVDAALDIDDREYQRQLQIYVSQVMSQVYGEVKYPRRAIKYSWEGRVELLARFDASGELIEVLVDSSSGHSSLDKAAESAIRRAAPFPELTPVAQQELESDTGDGYIMAIPVTFALR